MTNITRSAWSISPKLAMLEYLDMPYRRDHESTSVGQKLLLQCEGAVPLSKPPLKGRRPPLNPPLVCFLGGRARKKGNFLRRKTKAPIYETFWAIDFMTCSILVQGNYITPCSRVFSGAALKVLSSQIGAGGQIFFTFYFTIL